MRGMKVDQLLDVLHFLLHWNEIWKMMLKKEPRCDDIIEIVIRQGILYNWQKIQQSNVGIDPYNQSDCTLAFQIVCCDPRVFFTPFEKLIDFRRPGVFDLEANLMKAWPTELEGAYFCCLSNPQNQPQLMAELLKTVVHSPFYQVLTAAPEQVLLLSNLNTPIHSRLWCVFEAHCANEMNIEVRLAGPAVGLITNSQRLAWVKCGLSWISILSGPFFLFSDLALQHQKVCLLRSFMFVSCVCFPDPRIFWFGHFPKFLPQIPWGGLAPLLLGWMFLISLFSGSASYIAFSALYFVISLVVVLGTCYACNKANGMRNHAASFSLDVQNATCTSNKDTKMIREAIGGAMWMWKTSAFFWTCVELMANSVQVVFASVDSIQVYFFLMLKVQLCT